MKTFNALRGEGGGNIIAVHRNCPRPLKNAKWGHFLWILVLIYKYPDNVLNRTEQYEENNGDDRVQVFPTYLQRSCILWKCLKCLKFHC